MEERRCIRRPVEGRPPERQGQAHEEEVIIHYHDGSKFKGIYKDGKRNGVAIEEDKEGHRFEGSYKDDVRDGKFVEKNRDGSITAIGTYTNGRRQVQ